MEESGRKAMATPRVGKLTPRYSLLINPYSDVRLSKCPKCERLTHLRKFPLFIHVDGWGPLVMGKTCRYCTPCELIMVHQNELEAELTLSPARLPPNAGGKGYLVLGTVERKAWQAGLEGSGTPLDDMLAHTAEFKKRFDLHYEPGGWRPANEKRLGAEKSGR
jgi:hypothetical protein